MVKFKKKCKFTLLSKITCDKIKLKYDKWIKNKFYGVDIIRNFNF